MIRFASERNMASCLRLGNPRGRCADGGIIRQAFQSKVFLSDNEIQMGNVRRRADTTGLTVVSSCRPLVRIDARTLL